MRSLLVTLSFLIASSAAFSQSGLWQAHPSLRNAQSLSASDEAIWVGTDGGVYRYALASGEIERYTPVEGLSEVNAQAIAYDARRRAVWIGYPSGVMDRLDVETGEIDTFVDIARADQFNSRSINRIKVAGDSLLIATGFGLVVFDAVAAEVRDTYERFGSFRAGIETSAVIRAPLPDGRNGLWVGTREGVAYAPLDAPNLREPSAWTVDSEGPRDVLSLAYFQGNVFAGVERVQDENGNVVNEGGAYLREAQGVWTLLSYGLLTIPEFVADGDRLIAVSLFRIFVRSADGRTVNFAIEGGALFNTVIAGPDGGVWAGEVVDGLIGLPDLSGMPSGVVSPRVQVIPNGPGTNDVLSTGAADDGEVWAGFFANRDEISVFSRFDGTQWENYTVADGSVDVRPRILAIVRDRAGSVWLGSQGGGVFRVPTEGEVERYTVGNSSLAESGGFENYVEATGLAVDASDNLWVTNRQANPPLHVRTPEGEWAGLQRPSSVSSSVTYREIALDSFGYKWISTRSTVTNAGTGLVVLDTRGTPLDDSDDRAVYVGNAGSVGTGLPSEDINAIAEDRSGRMWIGTARGLATVFSPGSIFSGNAASQITWTRNPESTEFFLRDLRIYDIAVDPADRKWLASSSGAWLINPEGNEVIANFTSENSPLPSDEVLSVTVDESDGRVHFATSGGVYSYRGGSIAAVRDAEDLFVYPNPVRADGGALPPVAITGLVDNADVRVLTVDGQLVASFATRGGSVSWDGRDERTGDFVPSGVYLVVADGEDGTAYGKIAVVR